MSDAEDRSATNAWKPKLVSGELSRQLRTSYSPAAHTLHPVQVSSATGSNVEQPKPERAASGLRQAQMFVPRPAHSS